MPFKFQAVISQYLLKEAAPETTLESEFYYMEKGTFVYETYRQLKARAKVRTQTVKKTMTGKEKIVYKEEIWTVEELAQMNLARKKAAGLMIEEIELSKLGLMTFSI